MPSVEDILRRDAEMRARRQGAADRVAEGQDDKGFLQKVGDFLGRPGYAMGGLVAGGGEVLRNRGILGPQGDNPNVEADPLGLMLGGLLGKHKTSAADALAEGVRFDEENTGQEASAVAKFLSDNTIGRGLTNLATDPLTYLGAGAVNKALSARAPTTGVIGKVAAREGVLSPGGVIQGINVTRDTNEGDVDLGNLAAVMGMTAGAGMAGKYLSSKLAPVIQRLRADKATKAMEALQDPAKAAIGVSDDAFKPVQQQLPQQLELPFGGAPATAPRMFNPVSNPVQQQLPFGPSSGQPVNELLKLVGENPRTSLTPEQIQKLALLLEHAGR